MFVELLFIFGTMNADCRWRPPKGEPKYGNIYVLFLSCHNSPETRRASTSFAANKDISIGKRCRRRSFSIDRLDENYSWHPDRHSWFTALAGKELMHFFKVPQMRTAFTCSAYKCCICKERPCNRRSPNHRSIDSMPSFSIGIFRVTNLFLSQVTNLDGAIR